MIPIFLIPLSTYSLEQSFFEYPPDLKQMKDEKQLWGNFSSTFTVPDATT